jgi:hypothetical protein
MNKLYKDLILVHTEAAVAGARAASGIEHPVLKGELCEIVMRDLLRPLLPADIALGTGVVITSDNKQSSQQDIVLIDRSIVPPILLEGTTGIFPIESVLFAIEVKKRLDADGLAKSIENARELCSFYILPGEHDDNDIPNGKDPAEPISALLAFDSDLKQSGKSELVRFKQSWPHLTAEPPIKVICVVGRGCWYWKKTEWEWKLWPLRYQYNEVISFLATIMNSYKNIRKTRGEPRLGEYLLER